jgi:hypothetical protein
MANVVARGGRTDGRERVLDALEFAEGFVRGQFDTPLSQLRQASQVPVLKTPFIQEAALKTPFEPTFEAIVNQDEDSEETVALFFYSGDEGSICGSYKGRRKCGQICVVPREDCQFIGRSHLKSVASDMEAGWYIRQSGTRGGAAIYKEPFVSAMEAESSEAFQQVLSGQMSHRAWCAIFAHIKSLMGRGEDENREAADELAAFTVHRKNKAATKTRPTPFKCVKLTDSDGISSPVDRWGALQGHLEDFGLRLMELEGTTGTDGSGASSYAPCGQQQRPLSKGQERPRSTSRRISTRPWQAYKARQS